MADPQNFAGRLRSALPLRWFPDQAPILAGVLAGLAATWQVAWSNIQFVRQQSRVATASGAWLDAIAMDFFGTTVTRSAGLADSAFRALIIDELFRTRGTRASIAAAASGITGVAPAIFEPTNIRDTGACGSAPTLFYVAGPAADGTASSALAGGMGGYANGTMVFEALVATAAGTDQAASLRSAVSSTMPCAGIAWLRT